MGTLDANKIYQQRQRQKQEIIKYRKAAERLYGGTANPHTPVTTNAERTIGLVDITVEVPREEMEKEDAEG
jgi:hypothetical protein